MTVLVFDIETIPDTQTGRTLHGLKALDDASVAEAMFTLQQAKTGKRFLPHYLQQVVAISVLVVNDTHCQLWSLGECDTPEKDLIQRFFNGIEKYRPTLVSWNGTGFDLPVLHYRGLQHGVTASTYWEVGDTHNDFKWNNYVNRFHMRHMDVMDILSGYQARAFAPLDTIAHCLNLPGKMGQSGGSVWQQYLAGDIQGIRDYCETDVLNTYLTFLQLQAFRGVISESEWVYQQQRIRDLLAESDQAHLQAFNSLWTVS